MDFRTFVATSTALLVATVSPRQVDAADKTGKKPAAETQLALTQVLVNAEYARMYNYLKAEQEKAKAQKKSLVIISAEAHTSSNSSILLQLMLANICERLGVKEFVFELNNEKINPLKAPAADATALAKANPNYIYNFDLGVLKEIQSGSLKGIKFPITFDLEHKPELTSINIMMNYMLPRGFNFNAGDPLHNIMEDPAKTVGERLMMREDAMLPAIKSIVGDRVCNNGALHVPNLEFQLAQDRNLHVVPLDFTCGAVKIRIESKNIEDGLRAEAYEAVDRVLREYYTPKIPINPQLSSSQCFAMAWLAAIDHKETSPALRETLRDRILQIVPEIPGIKSPEQNPPVKN